MTHRRHSLHQRTRTRPAQPLDLFSAPPCTHLGVQRGAEVAAVGRRLLAEFGRHICQLRNRANLQLSSRRLVCMAPCARQAGVCIRAAPRPPPWRRLPPGSANRAHLIGFTGVVVCIAGVGRNAVLQRQAEHSTTGGRQMVCASQGPPGGRRRLGAVPPNRGDLVPGETSASAVRAQAQLGLRGGWAARSPRASSQPWPLAPAERTLRSRAVLMVSIGCAVASERGGAENKCRRSRALYQQAFGALQT